MTYVLMIDVDRPNIEQGMKFFQDFFDGDLKNSPNGLQYMFLPLYKKTYSEDERLQIIKDNDHHTEGVSVVALSGLNHLDNIVQLQQGSTTTIRNLLLAVPAPRTSNKKLFLQVERQAGNSWLLCCFYTTDSTEVTLRLGSLESLLKKYVKTDDLPKLFQTEDFTLKFNGQAAPLKKGKSKYIFQEVPAEIASYANRAMGKLITASQKRVAIEIEDDGTPPSTSVPILHPKVTHQQRNQVNLPTHRNPLPSNNAFQEDLLNQNNRLSRLEECCGLLAQSTKNLEAQFMIMHDNVNAKFQEMTTAISKITSSNTVINKVPSPNRRSNKLQKPLHDNNMDLDYR